MTPFRNALRSLTWILSFAIAHGLGEIATLEGSPLSKNMDSHRQDVCDRYQQYRAGEIELQNALSGLSIRPVFVDENNPYFVYNDTDGIAQDNPGILVELMDAIAARANFTWRSSFGVTHRPVAYNVTFSELLLWSVENFDISMSVWTESVERMEQGVSFTEPWYDSSLILIDRRRPVRDIDNVHPFNWTKPFEPAVWALIVFTIILSAIVFQLIEHLTEERHDRTIYQWFSDNLYLSILSFAQHFEYAPNSAAGRLMAVSMALWTLVIAATYTANLASLFVDARVEPVLVESIEEAVVFGYPVCTFATTLGDLYIQEAFPKANRVPKPDEVASFQSLRNGECPLVLTDADFWLTAKLQHEFNPDCDLEWIGGKVKTSKSALAVKADVGHKCSSLVRHVINLHLVELIEQGVLAELWRKHRSQEDDGLCEDYEDEPDQTSDRKLGSKNAELEARPHSTPDVSPSSGRKLVVSKAASSQSDREKIDAETLTVEQMMGTFLLHWMVMLVAVVVSCGTAYFQKTSVFKKEGRVLEKVTTRAHGPVVGMPPPVNTWVVRNSVLQTPAPSVTNGQEDDPPLRAEHLEAVKKHLEDRIDKLDAKMELILQLLKGQNRDFDV